jgi:hypothetical protein
MFTINIKGKENPKTPQLVKLEAVFFKTGYARVTKALNITGPIKDWDSQTQQFKSKGVEASEKNQKLIEFKTKYLKVAEDWEAECKQWAPVQWSHSFDNIDKKRQSTKVISVCQMFDILNDKLCHRERIKNGNVLTSVGTARRYRCMRRVLEEFTLQKYNRALSSYYFEDITEEFADAFCFFLQKRGAENGNEGNLYGNMKVLRGIVYYANKMGVPDADMSIFQRVQPKMKPKKFEPKTIPLDVIRKIENVDRTLFSRIEQFHIDLFLFSFYTGGMANVDVCFLTWDCIDKDGRLTYERTKFPKKASIIFHPKARAIAEKYKNKCFGNYVLPIFYFRHTTESKKRSRMNKIRTKVNITLRKLSEVIKYNDKITWYSARGTFITTMIADNVHPAIVAEMAGNSPQTIFKHYFKNTTQKAIDNQVMNTI